MTKFIKFSLLIILVIALGSFAYAKISHSGKDTNAGKPTDPKTIATVNQAEKTMPSSNDDIPATVVNLSTDTTKKKPTTVVKTEDTSKADDVKTVEAPKAENNPITKQTDETTETAKSKESSESKQLEKNKEVKEITADSENTNNNADDEDDFLEPTEKDTWSTPNGKWHFVIAPYMWLSGIKGDITVKGNTTPVDIKPYNIVQILKDLDFVAQVHMEASKGNWSYMLDPTYLKISPSKNLGPLVADVTMQLAIIDGGVFYQVDRYQPDADHFWSLQLMAGARYLWLKSQLRLEPTQINIAGSANMLGPLIGIRLIWHIKRWDFWARGDYGGFGINHLRSTWGGNLFGSYSFTKNIALALGFRALGVNYSKGQGADLFKMDTTFWGPVLGLKFRWSQ